MFLNLLRLKIENFGQKKILIVQILLKSLSYIEDQKIYLTSVKARKAFAKNSKAKTISKSLNQNNFNKIQNILLSF